MSIESFEAWKGDLPMDGQTGEAGTTGPKSPIPAGQTDSLRRVSRLSTWFLVLGMVFWLPAPVFGMAVFAGLEAPLALCLAVLASAFYGCISVAFSFALRGEVARSAAAPLNSSGSAESSVTVDGAALHRYWLRSKDSVRNDT